MASPPNFLRAELDISTKLLNLEERASKLEEEFGGIMSAARELSEAVKRYVDKCETETRSWEIMECIIEGDRNARDILDHVKIFFNFLLAKMASKRAELTDLKMLWHLLECEGVKPVFSDAIRSFGFKGEDADDIKLLLAVTYKLHVEMEREVKTDEIYLCDTGNGRGKVEICSDTTNENSADQPQTREDSGVKIKLDKCSDQSMDIDYTSLDLTDSLKEEHLQNVLSWNVADSMKNVGKRMIAIVLYTLNLGRADKDFLIISHTDGAARPLSDNATVC